jgi:hypothetical protein
MALGNLSLVKSLSRLHEEQKHSDEIHLEPIGLTLTRGSIVEIAGDPSSGKTAAALSLISKLTSDGEICAVVDACNSYDPCTALLAGVKNENLLWVQCSGDLEKSFISADYLVQAKGFGAIWLNLNGLSESKLRQVPKTYWYRYRNRITQTPTLLIVTVEEPVTGSASQQSYLLSRERADWSGKGRFKLLREFRISFSSRKQFYSQPVQARLEFDYTDV